MAKFPFKRPRIISKKFPELDSSIDGVSKSLNDLVFSYHEQVQNALTKKHWLMAFSSLALILVLGSFISMKGKADSSIFYPETCLGGWINPQNAQGEQQTTSNGDESQFTKDNSAVLPANTNAEMYCGNFKGTFDTTTKPTKIIVSLALTKGSDTQESVPKDDQLVSSPIDVPNVGTTSVVTSSSSSTFEEGSTTAAQLEISSTTTINTDFGATSTIETAIATPGKAKDEGPSVIDGIVKSVQDTISDLFSTSDENTSQTDTVVVPVTVPESPSIEQSPAPVIDVQPAPQIETPPAEPTSYNPFNSNFYSHFFETVFAEEVAIASTTPSIQIESQNDIEPKSNSANDDIIAASATPEVIIEAKDPVQDLVVSPSILGVSTSSTENLASTTTGTTIGSDAVSTSTASVEISTSTDVLAATTTALAATTTEESSTQNNFLEVFYTFDGKTWQSLGVLNEISMKYRTFEIPVTVSTSWADMSKLQIKIESRKQDQDTPMVYLDGVRVDVLYETTVDHAHPDFKRDTILKDETYDGMRVVTIINNDTNREEVWYMYLDTVLATSTNEVSTSTALLASSTAPVSIASSSDSSGVNTEKLNDAIVISSTSSENIIASSTLQEFASSTTSTSSPYIKPVVPKNTWLKFDGVAKGYTLENLVSHIKKVDEIVLENKQFEDRVPDFTKDTIKKIRGILANAMIVQVEKETIDELWIYDVDKDTPEKISTGSSTSVSSSFPIAMKGGYVFWLSKDEGTVFAYSIETKTVQSKVVPPHNSQEGERVRIAFEGIPWVAVIGADGFFFFSETTGEVFSDDNSLAVEEFRKKMKLDDTLSGDEIDALNLIQNEEASESVEQ